MDIYIFFSFSLIKYLQLTRFLRRYRSIIYQPASKVPNSSPLIKDAYHLYLCFLSHSTFWFKFLCIRFVPLYFLFRLRFATMYNLINHCLLEINFPVFQTGKALSRLLIYPRLCSERRSFLLCFIILFFFFFVATFHIISNDAMVLNRY